MLPPGLVGLIGLLCLIGGWDLIAPSPMAVGAFLPVAREVKILSCFRFRCQAGTGIPRAGTMIPELWCWVVLGAAISLPTIRDF